MHTHINRSRKEQENRYVLSCPRKSGSWRIVCDQKWLHHSTLLQNTVLPRLCMPWELGSWAPPVSLALHCRVQWWAALFLGSFFTSRVYSGIKERPVVSSQWFCSVFQPQTTNEDERMEGIAWEKDFQLQLQAVSISGYLSVRSSSVGLPSLNRLEISQDFVGFVFQKHTQIITTIVYLNTSRLEEFWWACFAGTACHCWLEVTALGSVQRKEWKLNHQGPHISKQGYHLESTDSLESLDPYYKECSIIWILKGCDKE